jgi:hypothetical protein
MAATRAALHRNILDVFNEYGVQIMTPAYEGDTERPKIVPPEGWYPAPAVKTPTAADADGAKSGAAATQSATGGAQVAAAGASPAIEPGSAQR